MTDPITTASNPRVGEDVGRGNVLPSWVADMQPTLSRSGNDITLSYCNPNDAAYTFAEMERFFGASDFAFAPSPEAGAGGDLGELERLSAKATSGEWSAEEAGRITAAGTSPGYDIPVWGTVLTAHDTQDVEDGVTHWSTDGSRQGNTRFAVACVNYVRKLIRSGKLVASTGSEEETKGAPITQDEIVKLIAKTWLTAKGTSDEDAEEIAEPGELALISPEDHAACVEIADTLLHRFAQAAGEVRHDQ